MSKLESSSSKSNPGSVLEPDRGVCSLSSEQLRRQYPSSLTAITLFTALQRLPPEALLGL